MTGAFAEYTISPRLFVRHRTQPRTDFRCRFGMGAAPAARPALKPHAERPRCFAHGNTKYFECRIHGITLR